MSLYRFLEVDQTGQLTRARFTSRRLTGNLAHAIGDELTRIINGGWQHELHLDFVNVEILSAAMLGQLVTLHNEMRAFGGSLVLVNLPPLVYEVFEVMRLTEILDIRNHAQAMQQT
jgi:anti-anti-sigma regulatory factor